MTVHPKATGPRRRRRRRWLVVAGIVLLGLAATAYAVLRHRGAQTTASPPVTTTVHLSAYQVTVSGPGTLSPTRTVALTPSVSGRVLQVAAVGDRVQQGGTLARLDPASFQRDVDDADLALQKARGSLAALQASQAKARATLASQILAARSDVDAAQRSHDSALKTVSLTQTLHGMGSASATELQTAEDALSTAADTLAKAKTELSTLERTQNLQADADAQDLANARLAVRQAELTQASAQQDLAETTLTAPFSGTVSDVQVAVGEPAGSGGALLTLVDDSKVDLGAQIDESDVTQIAVGQNATVSVDALGDRAFPGHVTAIAPTATLVSNIPIFYVTIEIDNADRALRGGMTGQATIVTRTIQDTFQVPSRAVRAGNGGSLVTVQRPDGSYAPVSVTVVGTTGINSVLTGEVRDGAVVLVSAGSGQNGSSAPSNRNDQRRPAAVPFAPPGGGFRNSRRTVGARGSRR